MGNLMAKKKKKQEESTPQRLMEDMRRRAMVCTTHHYACDCKEYMHAQLRDIASKALTFVSTVNLETDDALAVMDRHYFELLRDGVDSFFKDWPQ
jgi:hypothetical protein